MNKPVRVHLDEAGFLILDGNGQISMATEDLDRSVNKELETEVGADGEIEVDMLCDLISRYYRFNQNLRNAMSVYEDGSNQPNLVLVLPLFIPHKKWMVLFILGTRKVDCIRDIRKWWQQTMAPLDVKSYKIVEWVPKSGPKAYQDAEYLFETIISSFDNLPTTAPLA